MSTTPPTTSIPDLSEDNPAEVSMLVQSHDVKIYRTTDDILDIINNMLETNSSEEAFYIVDLGKVLRQYRQWRELLPRVEPFYAVKCNSNPLILKMLCSVGCNFDVASQGEISTILSITKNQPHRMIFANPCKMPRQIKFARVNNVDLMTFDTEYELHKMKLYHEKAQLVLRIQVDDSSSKCKFNCKFGCALTEVSGLLNLAKILRLDVVGVSFHVGSGCANPQQYYHAIENCRLVFDTAASMGYAFHLLDLGGGFPGDNVDMFKHMCEEINKGLEEFFGESSPYANITIIAEPGRYMVTTSHTLVLGVIGKKEYFVPLTPDSSELERRFVYYMNDGVYGSFNCIYFDHALPTIYPFNERTETRYRSRIFGPTCDSLDKITEEVMLPELAIGEWCYVEDFGAYTTAASSNFNGFSTPQLRYIMTV